MSQTGINALDTTVNKTNIWLKELMDILHTQDKHFAYLSLRSVLHALRNRLPKEEVMHLNAQLPLLISGILMDGWHMKDKPAKWDHAEFLSEVKKGFNQSDESVDPMRLISAVFLVLQRHVTRGEIEDIINTFPKDLKSLWLLREDFELQTNDEEKSRPPGRNARRNRHQRSQRSQYGNRKSHRALSSVR